MPNRTSTLGRRAHTPPRTLRETTQFGDNPGGLRMWSYTPSAAGAPLVVTLHGCTQRAEAYAAGAGWLALAERHGFALLAPEQTQRGNPNRCFNWFEPAHTQRGAGEVASIAAMVRWMIAEHGLDASRVYVTGLSAGGGMAVAMLSTYPELFAGGAIVAGLPYGAAAGVNEAFDVMHRSRGHSGAEWGGRVRIASRHSGPWPTVSIWQGSADGTVAAANGEALAAQWRDLHGVSGEGAVERADRRTTRRWTDAAGRIVVEHHALSGFAHGQPLATAGAEGVGAVGPFMLEAGVSAALESARSWGLLAEDATPRPRAKDTAAERSVGDHIDAVFEPIEPTPSPRGGVDVAGVINRALAAAGLLR